MNFIKQARDNDWDALLANLRNFGDNFGTRRNRKVTSNLRTKLA